MRIFSLLHGPIVRFAFVAVAVAAAGAGARAADGAPSTGMHGMRGMQGMHHGAMGAAGDGCAGSGLACATAATPFFDTHDALWVAWAANGSVSVARSLDGGATFTAPVEIGSYHAMLDAGADARPQIAVDGRGHVAVAYGVFKNRQYDAQVMISTSNDGATFSTPRALSQEVRSQRFPLIAFDGDGTLFAAWLDKRTVAAAAARGVEQPGAALGYAWSRDGGVHFGPQRIAVDHTCECCRLGLSFDDRRRPVVLFRAIYGANIRDHAVVTLPGIDGDADGAVGPDRDVAHRVAVDDWAIDGCPHHGPSLAIAGDGSYQAAWFTGGRARQGLFYARSQDAGDTFSAPQSVGDAAHQAGRPQLLARGDRVWLVWKEFDGTTVQIKERRSADAGRTWSTDRVIASTTAYADHPLLIADHRHVYLSWLTREHGYRLIPIEDL